jgi:hypothetical protein
MSADVTTPSPPEPPSPASKRPPWLVGALAFVLFGLLGTAVAYYGIQDRPGAPAGSTVKADDGFITRIALPPDDTPIPDGPNRAEFRNACTVCHSARLVFTQPLLTEKQWTAVVHKMSAKYGAPLSADDERRMVQYLHKVHGK